MLPLVEKPDAQLVSVIMIGFWLSANNAFKLGYLFGSKIQAHYSDATERLPKVNPFKETRLAKEFEINILDGQKLF
jgi:hypothetical protein